LVWKIIFAAILLFVCFAIYVVYWNTYGRHQMPYESGHAIIYATMGLDNAATEQLYKNQGTLRDLKQGQSFYYLVGTDSARLHRLYNQGMQLHNLTHLIFNKLLTDTTLLPGNFGINMEYRQRLDGKKNPSHNIYETKHSFPEAHAALTQKELYKFLSLTGKFAKSAATQQRYNQLLKLTSLPAPDFYNRLFREKYYYLFFGEFAIIRS
jgi:hypothetical protein